MIRQKKVNPFPLWERVIVLAETIGHRPNPSGIESFDFRVQMKAEML
jgi:hypothetical protein